LEEHESVSSLQAVLLDNTPVNTGYKGGLVACLERKLGRKIHMIGCFLHMNELPLRHLINDLDGPTVTGNRLSGPIGKLLHGDDLYRQDPVQFEAIRIGMCCESDLFFGILTVSKNWCCGAGTGAKTRVRSGTAGDISL
jgi:hypothetical protein